jgi:RNA polymerase sigma factor (sigma-70 family)
MVPPLVAPAAGADGAFERLYRRHAADVYRYALAVLDNPSDAEDVTQMTFMNAFRALSAGEHPRKPRNWLIKITHNVCRQRFRQLARRPQEITLVADFPDRLIEDDQRTSAGDIGRVLRHLSFNQRAALVLREIEGCSYAEIAQLLGLSVGAVEALIFRARRAFREHIESALTCGEAKSAIAQQLGGRLSKREKGLLRGHLRECADCATFARRRRARRSALRGVALLPLPSSLASWLSGGSGGAGAAATGSAVGASIALKAAALVTAGTIAAGVGYETVARAPWRASPQAGASSPTASVHGVSLPKHSTASPGLSKVHHGTRAADHGSKGLAARKRASVKHRLHAPRSLGVHGQKSRRAVQHPDAPGLGTQSSPEGRGLKRTGRSIARHDARDTPARGHTRGSGLSTHVRPTRSGTR